VVKSTEGRFQRVIVTAVAKGKLPVEEPRTKKIILCDQNDKGGVGFASLVDRLAQKFEAIEEGGANAECVNPSASLPVRRRL
jgi:hypothetical protein